MESAAECAEKKVPVRWREIASVRFSARGSLLNLMRLASPILLHFRRLCHHRTPIKFQSIPKRCSNYNEQWRYIFQWGPAARKRRCTPSFRNFDLLTSRTRHTSTPARKSRRSLVFRSNHSSNRWGRTSAALYPFSPGHQHESASFLLVQWLVAAAAGTVGE